MKAKKLISLLAGVAFIAAFTVCPAFAGSDEIYLVPPDGEPYMASESVPYPAEGDKNLISGSIDYLGSVVDVAMTTAWGTFDSVKAVAPRRCGEPITYRSGRVMNRGSRWSRTYRH